MYIDLGAAKGVISIHAPLTGSDVPAVDIDLPAGISIHAPLTGSDYYYQDDELVTLPISIHAPLTGSDR